MLGLYMFLAIITVLLYVCVAVKIGFWVGDKTLGTGFDFGFYMVTVISLLALPFCIWIGVADYVR